MPPRIPASELPPVDEESLIFAELNLFRNQWGPHNPAFGEAKWDYALEHANRIDRAIDELKEFGDPWEVGNAIAAARKEIELALTQNMPSKAREELQLYIEMYSSEE